MSMNVSWTLVERWLNIRQFYRKLNANGTLVDCLFNDVERSLNTIWTLVEYNLNAI